VHEFAFGPKCTVVKYGNENTLGKYPAAERAHKS